MGSLNRWDFRKLCDQDIRFPFVRLLCQSANNKTSWRSVPYGMPQLNPEIEKVVISLHGQHPKTGKWLLGGSGFLFNFPPGGEGVTHCYAVTNWHLAVRKGFSSIRLYGRAGRDFIQLETHEWVYFPGKDDLAVADITDQIDPEREDIIVVDDDLVVDTDYAERENISFGDDVFMIGMFANSPGDRRNAPAARFGNIARTPNDNALIEQETGAKTPCYLIDMRSRTGFSGSPVFIYRTPLSDLRPVISGGNLVLSGETTMFKLLGIHCSQYPERFEVKKAAPEARGDQIVEGDELKGPSAMNVVIPAWRIREVLDHPDLRALRMERDKLREKAGRRDRPEPELVSEPPTTDANPRHKEDFNRLLGAAVREKQPDDQT